MRRKETAGYLKHVDIPVEVLNIDADLVPGDSNQSQTMRMRGAEAQNPAPILLQFRLAKAVVNKLDAGRDRPR